MANPHRWLSVGVAGVFGVALAMPSAGFRQPADESAPPVFLPVAYAAPGEVTRVDTLASGETLSELLVRSRLDAEQAAVLLAELQSEADPRALRAGATVQVHRSTRSGELRGVEFAVDRDLTVTLRRGGKGWVGGVAETPVRPDTEVLVGEVRSSLYQALGDAAGSGVPRAEREALADVLAERIFAWQIDFARDLRPGDRARLLVERLVRPDGSSRDSRLLAVQVTVAGTEHQAFLFRRADGGEDYFDADGESPRRAFLRAPLEFRRISSAYSTSRFHPVLKRSRPHHGIDYAASLGTPVRAVGDGRIARAGWGGGYGNVIEIRHSRGYASRYAHLRGFAPEIRVGNPVKQGDLIGYVGSTGLSTGPHLHYELHSAGRPVDPGSIRFLTGDPVPRAERDLFSRQARARTVLLAAADGPRLAVGSAAPGAPSGGG